SPRITANIFGPGDTLASIIANQFGEASGEHRAALIGCGVVLFALTILISMAARAVVSRADRRSAGNGRPRPPGPPRHTHRKGRGGPKNPPPNPSLPVRVRDGPPPLTFSSRAP